jgi:hypothetical protein
MQKGHRKQATSCEVLSFKALEGGRSEEFQILFSLYMGFEVNI